MAFRQCTFVWFVCVTTLHRILWLPSATFTPPPFFFVVSPLLCILRFRFWAEEIYCQPNGMHTHTHTHQRRRRRRSNKAETHIFLLFGGIQWKKRGSERQKKMKRKGNLKCDRRCICPCWIISMWDVWWLSCSVYVPLPSPSMIAAAIQAISGLYFCCFFVF